ncbi:acetate--CoA ligase family protein [Stella sp.]|uniref:acetate--CoA ligase family protein n=1 Tax=Stella sp. TaxID=2912054 RepID=UPI0035B3426B
MTHPLAPFFAPRSVAVVGASDDPTRLRGRILAQLVKGGFAGPIHPVHPTAATIQGLAAYPSIAATPAPPDLALIAIPSERVPGVLEECAAAGVRSALVYSGGFAEEGGEKRGLQDEVSAIAARTGMRVGGPNSVGFLNVAGAVCATFSPAIDFAALPAQRAPAGRRIGIVSQSGGLGFAIFNRGLVRRLAFSHVVNTGNEADIDASDVLDFLVDDPATAVVCMFLESVRRGDRFRAAAERALAAGKPIVVAKVGRSDAGRRAALSHTASLTGADAAYDSVFRHLGIIRVDDQDAMLDAAQALALCPPLAGRRVGIVTISGGVGGWMADTLEAHGFTVPALAAEVQARIREYLPPFGAAFNPVDITANAMENDHRVRSLEVLAEADGIDALVNVSSLAADPRLPAERDRLAALAKSSPRPILFYTYPLPAPAAAETLAAIGLPLYTSLAGVARGLEALATWHAARRPRLAPPPPGDVAAATRALDAAGETLCEYEAAPLLAAYGIPTAPARLARTPEEAAWAAADLGFPVALKIQSPDIPHKTDAGAVALGLVDADAVARACAAMLERVRAARPEADIRGVLVQPMAARGVEMLASVVVDPGFGPQVSVGLGGVLVELLGDIAVAPAPLATTEAEELVERLAGRRLLAGWRGAPAADRAAFADLVARLSRLAHDFAGRIAEIELNPVIVHPAGQGLTVVDALVRQRPKEPT